MKGSLLELKRHFFVLSKESQYIDSNCLETPLEPYLDKILTFVIKHPEAKNEFIDAFIQVAHDPNLGPTELIQYCMHALKWQEVRLHISEWLQNEKSERVRYVLRKIILSFDGDWYGASLYSRFNKDE